MQKLFDPQNIETQLLALRDLLLSEVFVLSSLGQLIIIISAFMAAWIARPVITPWIAKLGEWIAHFSESKKLNFGFQNYQKQQLSWHCHLFGSFCNGYHH